jgi:hypothetical protein
LASLIFLIFIRPRYFYKKHIDNKFIDNLIDELGLCKIENERLESKNSRYFTEIILIRPSNQLFAKISIRIMINYKPIENIENHQHKIVELNQTSNYHWVANMIFKDLTFLTKRPSINFIKDEILKMEQLLKAEKFEGITKKDSIIFGQKWDIETN